MRICVMACVYGRPQISRIFAKGIERLKKDFEIIVITGTSTSEDYELCKELGLNPVMVKNSPLGQKHNLLLEASFRIVYTHLLLMGSDDLISSEGLQLLIDTHHFHVGFRKMVAYDTLTGKMLLHEYGPNTRLIGAGRLINRHALEYAYKTVHFYPRELGKRAVKFKDIPQKISLKCARFLEGRHKGTISGSFSGIWESGLERALDNSFDAHMASVGFSSMCVESDKIHIIDLKSDNLNGFGYLPLQEGMVTGYDGKDWDWFLSEDEKTMIEKLKV